MINTKKNMTQYTIHMKIIIADVHRFWLLGFAVIHSLIFSANENRNILSSELWFDYTQIHRSATEIQLNSTPLNECFTIKFHIRVTTRSHSLATLLVTLFLCEQHHESTKIRKKQVKKKLENLKYTRKHTKVSRFELIFTTGSW